MIPLIPQNCRSDLTVRKQTVMKRFFCLLAFLLLCAGCSKTWKDPGSTVPASELPIAVIASVPNAYNGAGIIIKGVVWDLVSDELTYADGDLTETISYFFFKVADQKGNFVNVYAEGPTGLKEGDIVEVKGIYRKDMTTQKRYFRNEIEAVKVKVTGSSNKAAE